MRFVVLWKLFSISVYFSMMLQIIIFGRTELWTDREELTYMR
jgi:hypothetical protein